MISQVSLFFETPLYQPVPIALGTGLYQLLAAGKFDFYSSSLKENTTYTIFSGVTSNGLDRLYFNSIIDSCFITISIKCVRTDERFVFYFYLNVEKKTLIKCGQYPSLADLHISRIKEFDKVLSKEKLKEFTRAIGLAANGVGIGSFVYLRRIFEDLIEEAHVQANKEDGWNEEEYAKARMAEKIALLKKFLPEFLVENKDLYGILSIGIHSLTEEDCLAYFETVKLGIELILEEKAEKLEKKQRLELAKKQISNLKSTVAKP